MYRRGLKKINNTYYNIGDLDDKDIQYKQDKKKKSLLIAKPGQRRFFSTSSRTGQRILQDEDIEFSSIEPQNLTLTEGAVYRDVTPLRNYLTQAQNVGNLIPVLVTEMPSGEILNIRINYIMPPDFTERNLYDLNGLVESALRIGRDYDDINATSYLDFVEQPLEPQPLSPQRNGEMNCVIKAILDNKYAKFNTMKAQLLELDQTIRDTGATTKHIEMISNIIKMNISVVTITNDTWVEFLQYSHLKGRHIILTAHNNHATVAQLTFKKKKEATIHFVDEIDELDSAYDDAIQYVTDREGKTTGIINRDGSIYKQRFDECDAYQECWGDAGVGKQKLIEQFPQLKYTSEPNRIFRHSDKSGFYARTEKSKMTNKKFDHNQSYRSFDQSGCFKGFPLCLDVTFRIPNLKLSVLLKLINLHDKHGLLFVEHPRIRVESMCNFEPLYYNGSGFYDLHVCLSLLEQEKVDPVIKLMALTDDVFNPDFSEFTKNQFRTLVGKTTSKSSVQKYVTKDKQEALQLLYGAGEDLSSSNLMHTLHPIANRPAGCEKRYIVEIRAKKAPWQLFQLGSYVKQHQKLILFRAINRLLKHKINIISVAVDSIEVSPADYEIIKVNNLLDLGQNVGQWKEESIKVYSNPTIDVIDHTYSDTWKEDSIWHHAIPIGADIDSVNSQMLDACKRLFITGSAGTGKTQYGLLLPQRLGIDYGSVLLCGPENDLCGMLRKKAEALHLPDVDISTYHSAFSIPKQKSKNSAKKSSPPIKMNHTTYILDEASKITAEHFEHISMALQLHYNSPAPFANKRIILIGDFNQLPPVYVGSSADYDRKVHGDIRHSSLFKYFTKKTLTENHRQSGDNEFYTMLEQLKDKKTLEYDQKVNLIQRLNTRVITNDEFKYLSKLSETNPDDAIIVGKNKTIASLNESMGYNRPDFELKESMKVINTMRHTTNSFVVNNGAHGIVESITADEHGVKKITINFNDTLVVYYSALPKCIVLGTTMTIHRVQGRTYMGNVILDPTTLFEKNHLYVAISRAIKLDNIYLTQPIDLNTFIRC